ncbi:Nur1 protein [Saccharomycopsis crataegensis]|uniref:Nuclear rim protein 1 n=1 Tax=Saccharomycopsis crataegensis TaxID=43959 RepID=A0AAV5QHW7_9ASCO|nr:Nur1 protein [Saccharomycopsis crataegensis]
MISYPFDLYLSVNESLSVIDWDWYGENYTVPLGLLINILCHITFTYPMNHSYINKLNFSEESYLESDLFDASKVNSISSGGSNMLGNTYDIRHHSYRVSYLAWLFGTFDLILMIISVVNCYILFWKSFKTYSLLIRGDDYCPNTPSAFKEHLNYEAIQENDSLLRSFAKWVLGNDKLEGEKEKEEFVWKLNVWEPSKFQLMIFCGLSPIHIFTFYSNTFVSGQFMNSVMKLIQPMLITTILNYLVFHKFLILLKDRQIILSEALNEYDQKFIKPRLSKRVVDVAVDATKGPYFQDYGHGGSVQVFPSRLKSHQFQTFGFKEQYNLAEIDGRVLRDNVKKQHMAVAANRSVKKYRNVEI